MTLHDIIADSVKRLAQVYDTREARNIIELAIENIKGWTRVDVIINSDKEMTEFFTEKLNRIISRLLCHEPIQYILGETYWHGLTLKVGPGVLIPRPETSQLVDLIVDENKQTDLRVLDLCTGSGAIALALSRSLKFADITGVDISETALEIANENNTRLNTSVEFIKANALSPLPFSDNDFNIIVSNPPYICERERHDMKANVLEYEPGLALFVPDDDPMQFYRPIAHNGFRVAASGGRIYLEINPLYSDSIKCTLAEAGWEDVTIITDMYGKRRFAKAIKGK